MTTAEIKKKLQTNEYDFLRTNEHLGENIILLTVGGSHAYGTNVETSDLDIRGCAANKPMEILTNQNFEQFVHEETDTTIYSFNKLVQLLTGCNPNTIEIGGCLPEHYFYVSDIGQKLLDNMHLFLSQKAYNTFGSYARAQLRRLDNKAARLTSQSEQEVHILNSVKNVMINFQQTYSNYSEDMINLYIDKAVTEGYDTEIFMDINLHHYPLRDCKGMISEMSNVIRDYSKLGKRNKNAIEHGKISKHMMHLIRLFYMCFDILENEKIVTYREKDHDLLMDIRSGKYLDANDQPIPEFFEMVDELEKRLEYARENTSLPKNPDYKKINEFVADVNRSIVMKG